MDILDLCCPQVEGPSRYSREQLDAAVDALSADGRVAAALRDVNDAAPELQSILNQALDEGGFFGTAHTEEVRKAMALGDPAERDRAIRSLIAEETRLGMMIGVAVGMELARELPPLPADATPDQEDPAT